VKARAPGKVVISGAYAVLWGAPAIVSAVSRYAVADTARPADLLTPEVRAALGGEAAPWFDASALRGERGKLGLGSSAAILVASLAALALQEGTTNEDGELARAVLAPALAAHREAQGGGSGIDVATAAHGGTLVARLAGAGLSIEHVELPRGLVWQVWAGGHPTSTSSFVARVKELEAREPEVFAAQMTALGLHAEGAVQAVLDGNGDALLAHLGSQRHGLAGLGHAAGIPIVTSDVEELAELATRDGAVVMPSGAGGGDVALFVGREPPSRAVLELRARLGHQELGLTLAARGVHAWDGP
jgi:phosphomevalonate kinase